MNRRMLFGLVPAGMVALTAIAVVVLLLMVKVVWAWAIPDLLPGAVTQGLVAAQISWYTALKLAIFVAVVGAFVGKGGT